MEGGTGTDEGTDEGMDEGTDEGRYMKISVYMDGGKKKKFKKMHRGGKLQCIENHEKSINGYI